MPRKILVVEDEPSLRFVLSKVIARNGYKAEMADCVHKAKELLRDNEYFAHFLDIRLPDGDGVDLLGWIRKRGIPSASVVMTAEATMKNAVRAVKKGAFEYLVKPFDLKEIDRVIERLEQRRVLARASGARSAVCEAEPARWEIVGRCPAMQKLYKKIGKAAGSEFTVLITGESGTGKELVARNLHRFSDRKSGPFVPFNCAATPRDLIESELFGHLKGAFTGADSQRKGFIEEAEGGMFFMDEIGETTPGMQAKLLRLLEEGTITPVGSRKPIKTDVRFIAATNRNLKEMVGKNEFREDLFHRLNVIPIKIPPLRERDGDMELLATYFVKKYGAGRKISDAALRELTGRRWPGNVRQLENAIKRAVVMSSDDEPLLPSHFPKTDEEAPAGIEGWVARSLRAGGENIYSRIVGKVETELIRQAVEKCGGNKVKAAKLLGINRNTLSRKLKP